MEARFKNKLTMLSVLYSLYQKMVQSEEEKRKKKIQKYVYLISYQSGINALSAAF